MGSITVWECMLFLIRDNVYQWVCFSYWSLAASVGFVTTVAEDTAFCCAARGQARRQLPSFYHSRSAVRPNADLLSPRLSSPAPSLPSEGPCHCQAGRFFLQFSGLTPTIAGALKLWLAAAAGFKLRDCPEQAMLWWCAVPPPSGVVASLNGF